MVPAGDSYVVGGIFMKDEIKRYEPKDIILTDFWTEDILSFPLLEENHALIVRGCFEMEDVFRRKYTKRISFQSLLLSL